MTATTALATLIVGFVIGFIGQRSGFCSVTGYRDLYLIRDTYLIKGNLGMFIGALAGYLIFQRLIGGLPEFPLLLKSPGLGVGLVIGLTMIGGLGIGFLSILANGCPFRQHVRAAEGSKTAIAYIAGFYVGLLYFYAITIHVTDLMFKLLT